MEDRTCQTCGVKLPPRKPGPGRIRHFCSPECSYRSRHPRKNSKRLRTCVVCGIEYRYSYSAQRACGRVCGRFLCSKPIEIDWRQCHCGDWFVANRRTVHCKKPPRVYRPTTGLIRTRPCVHCGELITYVQKHGAGQRKCEACAVLLDREDQRRSHHRVRARKRGVGYEVFQPREIHERDGWRCQLCGLPVLPDKPPLHPRYPTLDHIVPLSLGGPHSRANVQCACRGCNIAKGTDAMGEQLRLIG